MLKVKDRDRDRETNSENKSGVVAAAIFCVGRPTLSLKYVHTCRGAARHRLEDSDTVGC